MLRPETEDQTVKTLENVLYHLKVEFDDPEYRAIDLIAEVEESLGRIRLDSKMGSNTP